MPPSATLTTRRLYAVTICLTLAAATLLPSLSSAKDQPSTASADGRFNRGDYKEAESQYRALINIYSDQPDLLTKHAWALLMEGAYDDARADFGKVDHWVGEPKKTFKVDARNLEGMGHLALEEQRFDDAEKYFRHASDIDKKNGEYRFDIAQALFHENRLDDCLRVCNELKNDAHAFHAQAELLALRVSAKTGVPGAVPAAAAIVYQNSTKDYLHYLFGQLLEDANDTSAALAQYKIALTLSPQRWLYQRSVESLSKPPAAAAPTAPATDAPAAPAHPAAK